MKKLNLKVFGHFGRRQATLVSLVILIAIAGYINISNKQDEYIPTSGEVLIEEPAAADDYFTLSRLEKEKSRSAAMDVYREITERPDSSAQAKSEAQASLVAAAKAIETEASLEGLIKAKGFEDSVVYINGQSANIVIKTIGLTPAQAAQIKDLVIENAGIAPDKIKIVEIK
ncbi:MAG: Stage III sporulation protein AH [Firmicutes bacterium ADurb.Bin193]|nr:MAG: Stage III sporulation protein AH [Firmicutes bacterium ADurb.Bin193]